MEQLLADIHLLTTFYFSPWGAAKGAIWEALTNDRPWSAQHMGEIIQDVLTGKRILSPTDREMLQC